MDETEKALVTTTDKVVNEGNTDMIAKPNVVKEAITPTILKKKVDTVNKTEKPQTSNETVDTSSSNNYDKCKSLDDSRTNQRTYTEKIVNKVNKSRSISRISLSQKRNKIEKPSEIGISADSIH